MNNKRKIQYSSQSNHEFLTNSLKVRRVYGDGCNSSAIFTGLIFGSLLIAIMLTSIFSIYEKVNLGTNDLPLETTIGVVALSMMFGIAGGIIFVLAISLAIKRIKLMYFLWEINHGDSELVLLCIDKRRDDIKYINSIKNKSIAMKYGALAITQSAKCKYRPFYYFRDEQQYILIVQNKNTGNFLVVDTDLKRLKIREQQRSEIHDLLNAATID
ncbi:MAG: hypothetical protein ACRCXK_10240 [Wohlfahrtiimonas sp.]